MNVHFCINIFQRNSNLKYIFNLSFAFCSSLTQITIPSSVEDIGPLAFYYCTSLKKICLPSSILSIQLYTFKNCVSLTKIQIPKSVKSIDYGDLRKLRRLNTLFHKKDFFD